MHRLVFVSRGAGASRDFVSSSLPASSFLHGTNGTCAQIRQLLGIVKLSFVTSLKVYISFSTIVEKKLLLMSAAWLGHVHTYIGVEPWTPELSADMLPLSHPYGGEQIAPKHHGSPI